MKVKLKTLALIASTTSALIKCEHSSGGGAFNRLLYGAK